MSVRGCLGGGKWVWRGSKGRAIWEGGGRGILGGGRCRRGLAGGWVGEGLLVVSAEMLPLEEIERDGRREGGRR